MASPATPIILDETPQEEQQRKHLTPFFPDRLLPLYPTFNFDVERTFLLTPITTLATERSLTQAPFTNGIALTFEDYTQLHFSAPTADFQQNLGKLSPFSQLFLKNLQIMARSLTNLKGRLELLKATSVDNVMNSAPISRKVSHKALRHLILTYEKTVEKNFSEYFTQTVAFIAHAQSEGVPYFADPVDWCHFSPVRSYSAYDSDNTTLTGLLDRYNASLRASTSWGVICKKWEDLIETAARMNLELSGE